MKIAFDVDGVITENPSFYAVVTKALMNDGHQVYIITDFDEHFRDQRVKELESYGIKFTELIITSQKEQFCSKNNIEYLLDDDLDYLKNSKVTTVHLAKIGDV